MTSYKLANYIVLRNSVTRDKYLPRLLISNRNFCSQDDKTKTENSNSKNQSSKEKKQKQKEESLKVEASSPEEADSEAIKKSAAKEKLMSLLSGIKITADNVSTKTSSALNLAKPSKRISKSERLREMEENIITPEKEIDIAVKAVASSFKEDPEKIESELATKLSSINLTTKPLPEEEEDIEDDYNSELNNEMNKKLMSSVEEVADAISESPIPARSELTKRLMRLSIDQKLASEKKSVKSVVQSMAIQSTKPVPPALKKQVVKKTPIMKKIERINLFGSSPLNIFTPGTEQKPGTTNDLWRKLEEREVRLLTQFGPTNAFEEMIMWTEQGKHWKFPIDNQTEMGEEEKIGFHEHVFLEHHLKGFPVKGPIRQFMELVVVGLSKNPYITVERKLDHIEWFRTYFKDKEDILREEGAIE